MEGYHKGKFCFICLQMYDKSNKKPPFRCSLCKATYHHSCHEEVFGSELNSHCCSPSIDHDDNIKCNFCLRKTGLLAIPGKPEAYHLECTFNDKLIVNKRFVQETKGKVCNACGSWRGTIFECGHPASSVCNQAFHLTCHQNLLLSMPLTLERLLTGGPISLVCSMHQSEEQKCLMTMHTQYLKRLSIKLIDEVN